MKMEGTPLKEGEGEHIFYFVETSGESWGQVVGEMVGP